jgi:hypothetical protein
MVRARGLRVVLITYPRRTTYYEPINEVIRAVAAELDVPLVDATASAERVPAERRLYVWADHPSAPIYAEVARDVAALIE